jgi:hypothetical protein
MAGVTSDAAAKFVREACLGKISEDIPLDKLSVEMSGNITPSQSGGSTAFHIHLENKSPYAITELIVRITTANGSKWNDYRVTNFLPIYTGPGIVTGLPPDPASYLQVKPLSSVYFSFPIREQVPSKEDKWSAEVTAAKGYLAEPDYEAETRDSDHRD